MKKDHPYKLGFRQLPDSRDEQYPLSNIMRATKTRPLSKVWKPGPVTDQGSESSCVGHSTYKLLTSEPVVSPKAHLITPSYIYVEAKKIDEWTGENYDGTSVRAGLNILKRENFITGYYWAENIDEAVAYLLKFGPLVLGIRWTDSMFTPDAQGFIEPRGNGGGGHAILAHAANWKAKTVTLRNSWGPWGKSGDCLLSLDDLDMLLKEGGVAAAVTE